MGANAIQMFKGDDRTLQLSVTGVADISGATLMMTVKTDPSLPDAQASIQLSTAQPSEIQVTGATTATINLAPAHMSGLDARAYVYDIEMQLAGKTHTLAKDDFILLEDVTKGV